MLQGRRLGWSAEFPLRLSNKSAVEYDLSDVENPASTLAPGSMIAVGCVHRRFGDCRTLLHGGSPVSSDTA